MRKLLTIIVAFAIISSSSVQAQKLKKESLGDYKYTQLPSDTRLVGLENYHVEMSSDYYLDSYEKDNIENAVKLSGFDKISRTDGKQGAFLIKIWKYPVKIGDSSKKERVDIKKKDGVETKTRYYHYVAKATYKYILRIYVNGEEIYMKENSGEEVFKGNESKSSSNAYENFKSARKKYQSNISKDKVGALSAQIDEVFGYPVKKVHIRSAHIKPKKHNYDDYEKVYLDLKAGYNTVKADENNIDGAKESLSKAIEGFETILKESDLSNKKARINEDITGALYYNIGHCYLFMKDYAKANEYYNKGFELKKLLFGGSTLTNLSKDMLERAEANK